VALSLKVVVRVAAPAALPSGEGLAGALCVALAHAAGEGLPRAVGAGDGDASEVCEPAAEGAAVALPQPLPVCVASAVGGRVTSTRPSG
jgi:hypothetical protein